MNKSLYLLLLFLSPLLSGANYAQEIIVNTPDGETFFLDVDTNENLVTIQDKITSLSNKQSSNLLIELKGRSQPAILAFHAARSQGGYLGFPRNYLIEVEPEEKALIRFIIITLANKTLFTLAIDNELRKKLETAGDDIDHIHPLRFLMTVFTDEELKVGIRNIRGKGWIWHQFIGGLKESLSTEMRIENMKPEYIQHFGQMVKVDPNLLNPSIQQQKWDEFIDLLITLIPRKGDHDRYDS